MLSVATRRRWRGVAILKFYEREIGKESKASSPIPFMHVVPPTEK
jgi:hypothetical protein